MIPIEKAVEGVKKMKEGCGWTDTMPFLHIFHADGKSAVVAIPEGGTGPALWETVGDAILTARVAEGPVEGALFVTDARMKTMAKDGDESPPVPGELQERWDAGDRDGIVEALFITIAKDDGTIEAVSLPYDAEAQTWDEPHFMKEEGDEQIGGGIVDAMRLAVADIAPDGTKDEGLTEFVKDAHRNPLLRQVAQMTRGIEMDLATGEPIGPDSTDLEATAARIMSESVKASGGPIDISGVTINEYLEDQD